MKADKFQAVLDKRIALINDTLANKAKEYASNEDRLHNFKSAGNVLGCTPEQALLGMLTKHLVSVVDMVKTDTTYHPMYINEKLGDCINYFILLEAIMMERHDPTV